jgi:hypothetical protein
LFDENESDACLGEGEAQNDLSLGGLVNEREAPFRFLEDCSSSIDTEHVDVLSGVISSPIS